MAIAVGRGAVWTVTSALVALLSACGTGPAPTSSTAKASPPVVSIASPADGATFATAGVTVSGSVTLSAGVGLSAVSVSVNGGAGQACGASREFSCPVLLRAGPNPVTVEATDSYRKTGSASVTVTYDATGVVRLFPDPSDPSSSPFPSIDDSYLEVAFSGGFAFPFYGTAYASVFLNTNGGLTFGGGDARYDVGASASAVRRVTLPTIAVFWGDMDAAHFGGVTRTDQMSYRQLPDRFVVTYTQFQDYDEASWTDTATLTLFADGTITVAYGDVLSRDVLVGVFDGTHASDTHAGVQATFADYASYGTGIILFDPWGGGAAQSGQLDGKTITFQAP